MGGVWGEILGKSKYAADRIVLGTLKNNRANFHTFIKKWSHQAPNLSTIIEKHKKVYVSTL